MPRNRRLSVAALGKFSRVTGSHGTELSAIRRIDRAVRVTIGGARQDRVRQLEQRRVHGQTEHGTPKSPAERSTP